MNDTLVTFFPVHNYQKARLDTNYTTNPPIASHILPRLYAYSDENTSPGTDPTPLVTPTSDLFPLANFSSTANYPGLDSHFSSVGFDNQVIDMSPTTTTGTGVADISAVHGNGHSPSLGFGTEYAGSNVSQEYVIPCFLHPVVLGNTMNVLMIL
jgi:hypothetical protein